jgi:2-methylisocitrate lyase-like PEP mutase family enzyme
MGQCRCGFTTDPENKCNGTHRVVREVREHIAAGIEALPIEDSVTNAVGMQILAAKIARTN